VEAAHRLDELLAGSEVEVVRIAEEDRRAELAQALGVEPLHGALGADRHEGWRGHVSVGGVEDARPGFAVGRREVEAHGEHLFRSCRVARATGESWLATLEAGGGTGWPPHKISIASPNE
jgi:hypothetical protein